MNIWIETTLLALILAIPALWAVAFAHRIHITHKHLDEMIASIKSSPELSSTIKAYTLTGFSRKIFIPGLLHSSLSKSRFASIGFISHADVENFPAHLKKILSRDNLLHKISWIWALGVFLLLTIKDLPELSPSGVLQYAGIHNLSSITDVKTWSNGVWLCIIGLGFLMLFATLRVTDRFEKTHHREIFEEIYLKTEQRSDTHKKLLPRHIRKWMTLERFLMSFSIAWIAISMASREYFLNR
ncbi:hypothetical protein [Pseudomonas sp. zfem002]|uniref:hypothetical protein n=1 Tax=Pseudomonas sp. zfem002 TaxID=3078197 RepID=UPI002929892F|nr:hypothetical protein [Pseudomonas sp. zfem002]MDU9392167.1 hypothetical protein [Pseudomonas sp. zfem002]